MTEKRGIAWLAACAILAGAGIVAAKEGSSTVRARTMLFDAGPGARFPAGIEVRGSSARLKRKGDHIWAHIRTRRLPPGAYTNWWVIFNNKDECGDDGCNAGDFGNPDVMASVLWATGGVVDDDGRGTFWAHLQENAAPGQVLFGDGLLDAENAEVHYVIRYHGPASDDPDELEEQLTTVGGLCGMMTPPPRPITITLEQGEFPCYDPQAVVFPNR